MLELFPDTAQIDEGALSIGGLTAAALVDEFGSPLVVYDEVTLRTQRACLSRRRAGCVRRLRDEGVPERRDHAPARRGRDRRGRLDPW